MNNLPATMTQQRSGSGVRALGRTGARESALPRANPPELLAEVIGDLLPRRRRFHAADAIGVVIERVDARVDERLDSRAPERPNARAPERHDWNFENTVSVLHPHGEALGPGAQCIRTEREKNALSAGHTRSTQGTSDKMSEEW